MMIVNFDISIVLKSTIILLITSTEVVQSPGGHRRQPAGYIELPDVQNPRIKDSYSVTSLDTIDGFLEESGVVGYQYDRNRYHQLSDEMDSEQSSDSSLHQSATIQWSEKDSNGISPLHPASENSFDFDLADRIKDGETNKNAEFERSLRKLRSERQFTNDEPWDITKKLCGIARKLNRVMDKCFKMTEIKYYPKGYEYQIDLFYTPRYETEIQRHKRIATMEWLRYAENHDPIAYMRALETYPVGQQAMKKEQDIEFMLKFDPRYDTELGRQRTKDGYKIHLMKERVRRRLGDNPELFEGITIPVMDNRH